MAVTLPAPVDTRSRWQRLKGPTLLAAGLLTASVLLHVRDPHRGGSWGYCPWLVLTGTYCPGCGGLRAVNDLTNGDVGAAASSNLLFVASLPVVALVWGRAMLDRWRGLRRNRDARRVALAATSFLVITLAFAVARNLPFGAWLAP
jgi:hypothetical protein